jgi:hypothetical protein
VAPTDYAETNTTRFPRLGAAYGMMQHPSIAFADRTNAGRMGQTLRQVRYGVFGAAAALLKHAIKPTKSILIAG